MKVGDYVRTDIGEIRKVVRVTDDLYVLDKDIVFAHKDKIKISSPSIIDLIEVGDYVNGFPVLHIENNELICGLLLKYTEEDIKSIVTKEQFESKKYNLENN